MAIEDLLEHGEHILWQDRPTGPGTRRYRERVVVSLSEVWGPLILLAVASLGLVTYAVLTRSEDWIATVLAGVGFAALPLMLIGRRRALEREMRRAEFHYVLTGKRLIVMNETDGETVHIFAGSLAKIVRWGNHLHVRGRAKDDWATLADLKDAAAAERLIARTLGPIA